MRKFVITSLLFVSGATGLVYELVWSKYLGNLLGNSGQAHAVVLATFMGGLALGAFLFGSRADRSNNALRLYALLELAIGVYAFVFPAVLSMLGALYLHLAPALPEGGARVVPKLLLASLALLPPTLMMGGTVPALCRYFTQHLGGMRRELSRLYAVNSLGAAVGIFLAGTVLVSSWGLALCAQVAGGLNIALALVGLVLARRNTQLPAPEADAADANEGLVYPRRAVVAALVGVALSGFTAMLYQVTWIRLLAIVLGASTYAFTFIVTAFILGIALGSFWLMRRKGDDDALRLFGYFQVLLVLSVCVALPLYVRLPWIFWKAHYAIERVPENWPKYQTVIFALCCGVLLLPTFFMGASFPAAARAATAKVSELGRQLGSVYLWNTVGTVAGAVLAGLVLMPAIGMEGNFILGVVCNVAAAAVALWFAPTSARPERSAAQAGLDAAAQPRGSELAWRVGPTLVAAASAMVFVVATSGWSRFVANADAFRRREKPFETFAAYRQAVHDAFEVKFYQDDAIASVLVEEGRHTRRLSLRINGKVDASDADAESQKLGGHMGPLLHPREVKRVLVVGAGAAQTVGALLAWDIERIDLVEISPAVIDAARLFHESNDGALDDPRVHIHVDDAKTFMALAPVKYDLVVSYPSNPWVSGVSGLLTRDFYEIVEQHLEPDGFVLQWLHTYESTEEILRLAVRTLRETFPHSTTWLGPQDVLFVGSKRPLVVDPVKIAERVARPKVKADLAKVNADDLLLVLARQIHSEEGLAQFARTGPVNTDDLNRLEYEAPKAFFLARPLVRVEDERQRAEATGRLAIDEYLKVHPWTAEQLARVVAMLEKHPMGNEGYLKRLAREWMALAPDEVRPKLTLGRVALLEGDLEEAQARLEPLVVSGDRRPELVAAWIRLRLKQKAEAPSSLAALLVEAEATHPSHPALQAARGELCEVDAAIACAAR